MYDFLGPISVTEETVAEHNINYKNAAQMAELSSLVDVDAKMHGKGKFIHGFIDGLVGDSHLSELR